MWLSLGLTFTTPMKIHHWDKKYSQCLEFIPVIKCVVWNKDDVEVKLLIDFMSPILVMKIFFIQDLLTELVWEWDDKLKIYKDENKSSLSNL